MREWGTTRVTIKKAKLTVSILAGIHPVLEALRAGGAIERVTIARGAGGPRLQQIIDLCRERGIPVRFEPRPALDRLSSTPAHQGVVAVGAAGRTVALEDVLAGARLIVILDGIEDPHNLGAIVRTAHAAGADAVCVPERRNAPLSDAAAKAAAGALAHLPVARIGNVSQTLELLKERGFWIYGLDERGAHDYDKMACHSPAALVLGGEGKGLHQQVARHCDFLVRIPLAGQISSLNVSVAAGIALFEWKRRAK